MSAAALLSAPPSQSSFSQVQVIDRKQKDLSSTKFLAPPLLGFRGQYQDKKTNRHIWPITLTVITKGSDAQQATPGLQLQDQPVNYSLQGHIGTTYFTRYDLPITQGDKEQCVSYKVDEKEYTFFVPAVGQEAHVMACSCNGYQKASDKEAVGGISSMWERVNKLHKQKPINLLLGVGDQAYLDGIIESQDDRGQGYDGNGVWALSSIEKWKSMEDSEEKWNAPFTPEMEAEVREFYLNHYLRHFNQAGYAEALSQIPTSNQVDDHDIFDGWGSYGEKEQNSPVYQGIFRIAKMFSDIFQQQIWSTDKSNQEVFGAGGSTHFLRSIDEGETVFWGMDTRTERNPFQVISKESYDMGFQKLEARSVPPKFLGVIAAIPLTDWGIEAAETVIDGIECAGELLSKIPGLKNKEIGKTGLKDDIGDQWAASGHRKERLRLISRLRKYAKKYNTRVFFIGGDVHYGGAAYFIDPHSGIQKACDPSYMPQIISSPIGNVPTHPLMVTVLSGMGRNVQKIGKTTAMRLKSMHKEGSPNEKKGLLAQRNFATLQRNKQGGMNVQLHAEPKNKSKRLETFCLTIPKVHKLGEALHPEPNREEGTCIIC